MSKDIDVVAQEVNITASPETKSNIESIAAPGEKKLILVSGDGPSEPNSQKALSNYQNLQASL